MLKKLTLFASASVLAGQLFAGGFFLTLGNPSASPQARQLNAVLTVKATGCHDPATAKLTATAIGTVDGQRREIPLHVDKLDAPGTFAVSRQWPDEGKWVIRLEARNDSGQFTNSLVPAGPDGVDRNLARAALKPFAESDIDAMLK